MRPIQAFVLAVVIASTVPTPASAQFEDPARPPILLTLPAGARAQAMGRAAAAAADADAIFHNPAQLVAARGVHVSAQRYGGAATLATVSVATPFLGGGLGLGVQWLDYEMPEPLFGPELGAEPDLPLGGGDPASEIVLSLGYGRTYRGYRVGVAGKATQMQYAGSNGTFAADIGVARTFGRLTLGIAAQHLGPALRVADFEHQLPRRYTLGAAFQGYPFGPFLDLAIAADVPFFEGGTVLPGGGVELSYVPLEGIMVSGRAGLRAVESGDESPYSFGAAFGFDGLFLEYAYQGFDVPGTAHRIGIRLIPQG